jgi:hypothetical protein
MNTSSNKQNLENKIFVRVISTLTGLLGLTLFIVTIKLWQFLSAGMVSLTTLYGCLLIAVASYAWRNESVVSNKVHTICFWLLSAGMVGAVLFILMTPPDVWDLPLYHPKLLACLAMLLSAAFFARKAWRKPS